MSVIFDLKEIDDSWAESINNVLVADWMEYIEEYGLVGSEVWWQNYESEAISSGRKNGLITFVGGRVDEFGEERDFVEIDLEGNLVAYDRLGYWEHNEISVGASVIVESFEICVKQKYGPTIFVFVKLVEVVKT